MHKAARFARSQIEPGAFRSRETGFRRSRLPAGGTAVAIAGQVWIRAA
jgi:hypothetical protein